MHDKDIELIKRLKDLYVSMLEIAKFLEETRSAVTDEQLEVFKNKVLIALSELNMFRLGWELLRFKEGYPDHELFDTLDKKINIICRKNLYLIDQTQYARKQLKEYELD